MKKTYFILTVLFAAFASTAFSQTLLSGTLATSQTLVLSASPYLVTSDIIVPSGNIVTVDPGVEIKMDENVHIIVKGKVNFMGTASQMIYIHAKDSIWGNILLDSTLAQKSSFNYVTIENARKSVKTTQEPGAIYGFYSAFEVKNCHFKNNLRCMSSYKCPNLLFKDCILDSTNRGEKIHGQYCDNAVVDNTTLYATRGDNDAIDFDASNNVMISNNRIYGGGDDGIDIGQCDSIGCNGVTVRGNAIFNMFNKGVSNGEYCLNIQIDHNVIEGCAMGIGAKSGAHVVADHNSLYHNILGVNSYDHLNQIWGPGHLTVTNCIIANSDTTFKVDPTAYLSISYSLADDTLMPGTGNLKGNPSFVSPGQTPTSDFHLNSNSPAIDKGDPAFALDPDGTRSDMGAFYYNNPNGIRINYVSEGKNLYPNPSNGIFNVELPNEIFEIEVFDLIGNAVYKSGTKKSKSQIDLSGMAKGVYFIRITQNNKIMTTDKLIIAN